MSRKDQKLRASVVVLLAALLLGAAHVEAAEQARRLRRIETVERPLPILAEAPPLPEIADCVAAIHTIAGAYNSIEIDAYLDEQFPNRAELIDALARAEVRVTNLELFVESVENARFLPWQVIASEELDGVVEQTIAADCVADVRIRAAFDSSSTGERTVTDVSRGEWRVRFTRTRDAQGAGR